MNAIRLIPVLLVAASSCVSAADTPPARVTELAHTEFAALGKDPVIVAAVRERNASGETLEQVKALDEKWTATPGVADFMRALMVSDAGRALTTWKSTRPYVAEIFVMDKLGANVALTDKTSDYWQGDEKKFTECFKGAGEIYLGPVYFDESSQTYSIQVSVPVLDGDTLIGAICIGVDIERI